MSGLIEHKLRSILSSQDFCGLCLERTDCACSTDVFFEIILKHGRKYRRRLKDIIGDVFHNVTYLPASTNICKQCTDKTLEFYIFVRNIKETVKIIDCYVTCVYNKIVSIDEKLDPFQYNGDKKCSIVLSSKYKSKEVKLQKYMKVNAVRKENIATLSVKAADESASRVLEKKGIKSSESTDSNAKNGKQTDYDHQYYSVIKEENVTLAENNKIDLANADSDIYDDDDDVEDKIETVAKKKKKGTKKIKILNELTKKVTVKKKPIKLESKTSLQGSEETNDRNEKMCELCLKYSGSEEYKEHDCVFKCLLCPEAACVHEKYLNSYRQQIMDEAKDIKCPECEYVCKNKDNLIDHANKDHLNHRPYRCSVCFEKFCSSSDYSKHKMSHRTEKKYKCKICNIEFTERTKLASHNRKHKRLQQDKVKCNICSKEMFESTLNMHMKLHDGVQSHSFTCETCGKSFAFKVRLDQHKMTHSDPIPCNLCGQLIKPMSMYLHLRRHKIKLNPALKPKPAKKLHNKKCDYCEYKTYCKDLLEIHVNKEHLKVKPHVCNVCGASYMSKYYLNQHSKVHTEEKKYNCPICNKSLRHKIGLKKHMMLHTGEQPHICEVCGEGYKTVTMLKYHMQKHKGKNEQCPLCGGMYYSIKHVRSHIKKCHWEFKDRKFDYKQIRGLTKDHYYIFQDRRKALADDFYDDE